MDNSSKWGGSVRQVLIESGLITAEKLDEIGETSDGTKLGQLLVEHGVITAKELAMVIGLQMNIPCVNLSTYQIQPEALQLIPESMARKYNVIPLAITDNALQVATAEVDDFLILEAQNPLFIQRAFGIALVLLLMILISNYVTRTLNGYLTRNIRR